MLAAQFNGKEYFELNEIPVPPCPEDGLLVKVAACAVCGTDLKIMKRADVKLESGKRRMMDLPRVTGHELSGTIAEVGDRVNGFSPGDAVVIAATIPCLQCESCRRTYYEMCDHIHVIGYDSDGGFAEYLAVSGQVLKSSCAVKLVKSENLEKAALTEPLSCAINCYSLTPVEKEDVVVVMGGGPLGCFLLELARVYGASKTIMADVSTDQLDKAGVAGADYYLNPSLGKFSKKIKEITNERGADVVITACPAPEAQKLALEVVGKRGAVNFFGGLPRNDSIVALDTNLIHYKECAVSGTHGSSPKQVKEALRIIESGEIDMEKYISHRFPLQDINKALDVARSGSRLKILIKP